MKFGTDGIRDLIYSLEFNPSNLARLGSALAGFIREKKLDHTVCICRDTRASSQYIQNALVSGLLYFGVNVFDLGIQPTGLFSRFLRDSNFSLGINVTASHNTIEYNGIKIFNSDGSKLSREDELLIENLFATMVDRISGIQPRFGEFRSQEIPEEVFDFYLSLITNDRYSDYSVLIDCANGAITNAAKKIFPTLFRNVIFSGDSPNGYNINETGAMNLSRFIDLCKLNQVDFGFCFDGDGDRCYGYLRGHLVDGDCSLALLCKYQQLVFKTELKGIVGTVLSNSALEEIVTSVGAQFYRASVGDKEVFEAMQRLNYDLGGEPSGHILFKDTPVSDGILTAIYLSLVFSEMLASNVDVTNIYVPYAVDMKNYKLKDRKPFTEIYELQKFIDEKKENGVKVVIRYSGTENIVRVHVESKNQSLINDTHSEIRRILSSAGII